MAEQKSTSEAAKVPNEENELLFMDRWQNLVTSFCRNFAEEVGYILPKRGEDSEKEPDDISEKVDFEDVTGEKNYISEADLADMESVVYSISFGKQIHERKICYQAYSAAVSTQDHIELVLKFIERRQRIQEAKTCIFAYRLNNPNTGLTENYNDGNEEGCGEKLLM